MISKEIQKKVQQHQLLILKEVDNICSKNRIPYYLLGGSALVEIRHKGFIPWDDDIDIALFRDDYNMFIECCNKELKNDLFLQTDKTDIDFFLVLQKLE